jgi:hypothetical protein
MKQSTLFSRSLKYHKAASDSMFDIISTFQTGGEVILKQSLEKWPWMPESSKQVSVSLMDMYSKGYTELKNSLDQGYERMDSLVSGKDRKKEEQTVTKPPAQEVVKVKPVAKPSTAPAPNKNKGPATKKATAPKKTTTKKTIPAKKKPSVAKAASPAAKTSKPASTTRATSKAASTSKPIENKKDTTQPGKPQLLDN